MDITALLAAFAIAGAIILFLLAVYNSTAHPRSQLDRRLGHIIGEANGMDLPTEAVALKAGRTGRIPIISTLIEGKEWTEQAALDLDRADMRLTVSEFVAVRIFLGLASGLVGIMLFGSAIDGLVFSLIIGFIGYQLPKFYMKRGQGKRLRQLDTQLVEGLSLLSNSLKAGFGLMQSLDMMAKELEHPLSTEIRRTLHDINVGSSTDDALLAMSQRCGSNDLDIVVTAMVIQQSTGGNLAEILDNVGHTMRERVRIRGEIKTLTTQGTLSGLIIGALPIVIAGFIFLINPTYIHPLFTELAGKVMLGGAIMMEMFGVFLIKRILAIEV